MKDLQATSAGAAVYGSAERAQYGCLLIFCLMELFIMAFGGGVFHFASYYVAENFLMIPWVAFLGLSFWKPHPAFVKRRLLFCGGSVAWFCLLQLYHTLCGETAYNFSLYACGLLLAFPFAMVAEEAVREKGFRLLAKTYLGAGLLICFFSLLLEGRRLPEGMAVSYYWDCARLNASWGSNLGASLLLIDIGLALSAFFRAASWRQKAGYAGMAAVFFCVLSLTDCRTSIFAAGLLLAGCAALAAVGKDRKRILLAAAIFAAVLLAACKLAAWIFQAHTALLAAEYNASIINGVTPDAIEKGNTLPISVQYLTSDERSWDNDGATLNGRTKIWAAAFRALLDNPRILLVGRQDVGVTVSYYSFTPDTYPFPVEHTHNSWLETLFRAGIPGLASALYITWIAIRSGFKIVFSGAEMSKKCIAVLAAALLICAFLEPFLFSGDTEYHFLNIFFLFAVGYMESWQREVPPRAAK